MYRLIIVDDELEIRKGLKNYFPWDSLGFEVVNDFSNGKEALRYITNHEIDVILSDIKMPFLDGIELAKTLHEQNSSIKLIFLSGYRDFEYAQKAIAYGVKNYIVKPTKYNELLETFTKIKKELDEENEDTSSYNYYEDIISKVKLYIHQHVSSASLDMAASIVNLTPHYLSKIFKEHTEINFSQYVLNIKMKKAAELLENINYKTYEISEMLGYSSPKNFTRTFKKYYGLSPRDFRYK